MADKFVVRNKLKYIDAMMAYEFYFWVMALILAFTFIYPWRPEWPFARILVHLPWLLLPTWMFYEINMPNHMNIRLDIPLILFGIGIAFAIYILKLILFRKLQTPSSNSSSATMSKTN